MFTPFDIKNNHNSLKEQYIRFFQIYLAGSLLFCACYYFFSNINVSIKKHSEFTSILSYTVLLLFILYVTFVQRALNKRLPRNHVLVETQNDSMINSKFFAYNLIFMSYFVYYFLVLFLDFYIDSKLGPFPFLLNPFHFGIPLTHQIFVFPVIIMPIITEFIFRYVLIGSNKQSENILFIRTGLSTLFYCVIYTSTEIVMFLNQPEYESFARIIYECIPHLAFSLIASSLYIFSGKLSYSILFSILVAFFPFLIRGYGYIMTLLLH